MGIAETSRIRTVFGNKTILVITGTFANGDTTGDISTGLSAVDFASAQYEAAAKIINCVAAAGVITLATEDPTATKTFKLFVIGH